MHHDVGMGMDHSHAAAAYGHNDMLTYLVGLGGNVNITDSDGDTPLVCTQHNTIHVVPTICNDMI